MKKSRFTETQIVNILRQYEQGKKVSELCREHGLSEQTFYNWKAKYGGMDVNELKRVKDLEEENARLKKIVANQVLEIDAIKYILEKSTEACREVKLCKDVGGRKKTNHSSGLQNSGCAKKQFQLCVTSGQR